MQKLLLGADSEIVHAGRAITVQALGGTGGLKVGADFLRRFAPGAQVWISDPSWENHRALFEGAGFTVNQYAYYDPATRALDFPAMIAALERIPQGGIVVLHACCHNPTGADPDAEQWGRIIEVVRARNLTPFLDIAYQGFADGIDADGAVVRRFAATPGPLFISSSFSKSFSLYGERVGALTVVAADKDEGARVLSQVKRIVRANYSNPPTHGGAIVAQVLDTPELRALWEAELAMMRNRIKLMRAELVERLHERLPSRDFRYMLAQRGMFSYSGLTKAQVQGCARNTRSTPWTRAHLRGRPQFAQRRHGRGRGREGAVVGGCGDGVRRRPPSPGRAAGAYGTAVLTAGDFPL